MQDQIYQGMAPDFDKVNTEARAGACVVKTVLLMSNSSNCFSCRPHQAGSEPWGFSNGALKWSS